MSTPLAKVLRAHRYLIEAAVPGARVAFPPKEEFSWIAPLESAWRPIRSELEHLQRARLPRFHDVSPRQAGISSDAWTTAFMLVYGRQVPSMRDLCPVTLAALRHIPGVTTAMFSILAPGAVIPPHRGPFKGVLRCHLGLDVPTSDPDVLGIRVGNSVKAWVEGKAMVFDDTFEHEAWNRGTQSRAVLFLDVIRPLPSLLHAVNRATMTVASRFSADVREATERAERFAIELRRGCEPRGCQSASGSATDSEARGRVVQSGVSTAWGDAGRGR